MASRVDTAAGVVPAAAAPGHAGGMLAEVVDALADGLAIFDEHDRLVACNASFRRINAPIESLLLAGTAWEMLLRESLVRGLLSTQVRDRLHWMATRAAEGDDRITPLEITTPAGSILEVGLRHMANGGFLVTQRDITARHRYEESEREADMLLRKVLEACPANVVMSRVGNGHILYRSPAATELLGTSLDSSQHFASREERADFITALLPEGRVDDLAVTGVRPDGSHFPCLISARLIEYRGDEVVVSSTVDISKEVALRKTLAEQREQIFQAEKMSALGELLAGVAHELNNPLSVVVGHALMLREEVTDPEIMRRIEKISTAAERCGGIVKSFLAMARQQPVQLEPMDMRAMLIEVVELLEQGDGAMHADDPARPAGNAARGAGRPAAAGAGRPQPGDQRLPGDPRRRHRRHDPDLGPARPSAPTRSFLAWPTMGRASRRRSAAASSTPFSQPRKPARAPASALPSATASSPRMQARSG